jgi:hypothetical protein
LADRLFVVINGNTKAEDKRGGLVVADKPGGQSAEKAAIAVSVVFLAV